MLAFSYQAAEAAIFTIDGDVGLVFHASSPPLLFFTSGSSSKLPSFANAPRLDSTEFPIRVSSPGLVDIVTR